MTSKRMPPVGRDMSIENAMYTAVVWGDIYDRAGYRQRMKARELVLDVLSCQKLRIALLLGETMNTCFGQRY
jgi:hypothetical protein